MSSQSPTVSDALRELLGEVSADQLMEYNENIAQWVRLSGSDEERKSFDYIASVIESWGIKYERYNPICLVSLPGPATLQIVGGDSLPCITHSFSTTTGAAGVEAELVYARAGREEDYASIDARGKIVLTEGLAGPPKVAPSESHGAVGVISISGPEVHEMIISPVWGSPTPETVDKLPTLPHVSIDAAAGDKLKEHLKSSTVRVKMTTEVDTGWRPLPTLVAYIQPDKPSDQYVMFSGHVDSWHYGAMDNGSANASMMEVGRILSHHRDLLKRGVHLAFWSGHSHARYGTSTWYADEFWTDLHDHCVAHVNIDGPGAINATVLSEAPTMAESHGLARDLIEALTDQELEYRRIGRLGDQSFWGVGLPSFYCGISSQGPSYDAQADMSAGISGGRPRRGGTAWWWHTKDDLMDKIEPEFLARDARVLLATVYRLATDTILPFDQTQAVEEIRGALNDIAAVAGDAFNLSDALAEADALLDAANTLRERCMRPVDDVQADALNACIMRLSRLLIPVNYTERGPFEQDLALGSQPVPGLRPAGQLAKMDEESGDRQLLRIKLQRERNRVRQALRDAKASIDEALIKTS
ncbi:MAG: M28 family peptidase [Nitrolancea sp.]